MTYAAVLLHGFGARYDLPLSLGLYMTAAGAVVLLSFVLVAVFAGARTGERALSYPRLEVPFLRVLGNARASWIVGGAIGVLCLLAVVVCGLWGSSDPLRNPASYLVWIYLWAGLFFLTALVGNVWTYLSPFAALHRLLAAALPLPAPRRLPDRVGIWPAVVAFFGIAWLELASGYASHPQVVAVLAIAYTLYTLGGMLLFGRDEWLRRGEAFTVLFDIIGRFGPIESERGPDGRLTHVWIRPWSLGLLQPIKAGWDVVAFLILMLSNLAFDGIESTPPWAELTQLAAPLSIALGASTARIVLHTAGLLGVAVVFIAIFSIFIRLVIAFAGTEVDRLSTLTAFALTLVPIALVYNAAHNYSYMIVQGQGLIPTLADPLAKGWNLLPTRGYQADWTLAQAGIVWYVQVVLIVLGHVIAVYLAHLRAGERFRLARRVLVSQYPMLILMVAYTMTSLWILAQPITSAGG
jgi:hypothetical protein